MEWSPRWQAEIGVALDRYIQALDALRPAADDFAAAVRLEPLVETYAGTRALLVLGSYFIRKEARHAGPFLGESGETLKAALAEREGFRLETRRRETGLKGRYRPSIYDQDLDALLAGWIDAQSANFLLRGGKTRRVRVQMGLHADGDLPEDLGPDLTALVAIAKHLRAGCSADAVIAPFGPPWTDKEEAALHLGPVTEWADKAIKLAGVIGPMLDDDSALPARLGQFRGRGRSTGRRWTGA